MKILVVGSLFILGSTGSFAQGTVDFRNYFPGTLITHIYTPQSIDPTFHQYGNGSNDTPPGSVNWSAFTAVGANGATGPFGGGTTFAQLLSAPGFNQPESSLQPATPVTTFQTGSLAGFIAPVTAMVKNVSDGSPATLQMVVWDNHSGLYPTWSGASVAWEAGNIAGGTSALMNVQLLAGPSTPAILSDLRSFNLYYTPEPSTLALVGLGAALLFWRWDKARR